jgi:hypothetical protein
MGVYYVVKYFSRGFCAKSGSRKIFGGTTTTTEPKTTKTTTTTKPFTTTKKTTKKNDEDDKGQRGAALKIPGTTEVNSARDKKAFFLKNNDNDNPRL